MKNDTASKQEDTGAMVPVKEPGGLRGFIDDYNKDNSYPFRNFRFQMDRMMKGYDFDGKDILDVGCGRGYISLYLSFACKNSTIYALDEAEGDGSDRNVLEILEQDVNKYRIENINMLKEDINRWEPGRQFDIIVAKYSLHHIAWDDIRITRSTNAYLFKNREAREKHVQMFRKIKSLLKPGGLLVIWETSRTNIFRFIPVMKRHMNWKTKPTAREWLYLFEETGFDDIRQVYDIPYKLRALDGIWKYIFGYFIFPNSFFFGRKPVQTE